MHAAIGAAIGERFAVGRENRKHEQRNAHVRRPRGIDSCKARGGDADDFHWIIVDENFLADDLRIAAESFLPEAVAQHDRGRARVDLIVRVEWKDAAERPV